MFLVILVACVLFFIDAHDDCESKYSLNIFIDIVSAHLKIKRPQCYYRNEPKNYTVNLNRIMQNIVSYMGRIVIRLIELEKLSLLILFINLLKFIHA